MKNVTLGAFAFACASAFASTPGHALSFDFSFSNDFGTVAGTVTGEIDGLADNTTGPATAVFVNSAPPVFNLTTPFSVPIADALHNSFTVSSGAITDSSFLGPPVLPFFWTFFPQALAVPGWPRSAFSRSTTSLLRPSPPQLIRPCPAPSSVRDCPA